jgi:hypothetical protein
VTYFVVEEKYEGSFVHGPFTTSEEAEEWGKDNMPESSAWFYAKKGEWLDPEPVDPAIWEAGRLFLNYVAERTRHASP